MDFEELQKNWQSQPVHTPEEIPEMNEQIVSQWQKQQRGVMRSNIYSTIGIVFAFIVFAWVYFSLHEGRSIFFGGSILFMYILITVYLWIMWKGVANKKNDPTLSSKEYLEHSIQKLQWRRKTITTYAWIYAVLLWLALMCYGFDITQGGSAAFKICFVAFTTIYIFGMQILMKYTKQKKQLKKIDDLIADMQQLKDKIVE